MSGRAFSLNPGQTFRLRFVSARCYYAVAVLLAQLLSRSRVRQRPDDNLLRSVLNRQPTARQQARHALQVTLRIGGGQHRADGVGRGQGGICLRRQQARVGTLSQGAAGVVLMVGGTLTGNIWRARMAAVQDVTHSPPVIEDCDRRGVTEQ